MIALILVVIVSTEENILRSCITFVLILTRKIIFLNKED